TSLERRIDEAQKSDTPWEFTFVLRGGWRQLRDELSVFREIERADLFLVAVAVRQLLSLDAGCIFEELLEDTQLLGRPAQWARNSLELLRRRGAILMSQRIRCPHIESARAVIQTFFADRRDQEFANFISFLRSSRLLPTSPLRGISWFISEVS